MPEQLTLKEVVNIAFEPGDKKFFQFHNFLNKLMILSLSKITPLESLQRLTPSDLKKYEAWYQTIKIQSKLHYLKPALPTNGNNEQFHWNSRQILESMDESGDIYAAFRELKKLADKKGVKLVVYNTPTVSSEDVPYIYPRGFLNSYDNKLSFMMLKLGINYYDFQSEFIWDDRYTNDFVHLGFYARERIHAKLIDHLFFKEKII
jgi:hypothetical protein